MLLRLIAILLLLAAPASAFDVIVVNGGSSCSAASEYIGNNTNEASNATMIGDYLYCRRFQPTCSGNLNTAYIYHYSTGSDVAKVLIYSSSGASPTTGDTLLYNSGQVAASSDGWASIAVSGSIPVDTASWYWVCSVSDTTAWAYKYTTGEVYYKLTAGWYASPPTDMGSGWVTLARTMSVYFSVGQ